MSAWSSESDWRGMLSCVEVNPKHFVSTMLTLIDSKIAVCEESLRQDLPRFLYGDRLPRVTWKYRSRLVRLLRRGLR